MTLRLPELYEVCVCRPGGLAVTGLFAAGEGEGGRLGGRTLLLLVPDVGTAVRGRVGVFGLEGDVSRRPLAPTLARLFVGDGDSVLFTPSAA